MDILSYLIGKKSASGGGGGSSDLDWTALGYEETPPSEQEVYNHALELKNNWSGTGTFSNDKLLDYVPMVDCSSITNAQYFISNNPGLRYVPALNMESITDCRYMFYTCPLLKYVDCSNFNTENVTRMEHMFGSCPSLEELDLSSFYTPNLARVSNMFNGCTSLRKIDMRNFTLSQITTASYYSNMFNNVPTDCLIIVKDNIEKTWITEKFNTLTNVKTVDEYTQNNK